MYRLALEPAQGSFWELEDSGLIIIRVGGLCGSQFAPLGGQHSLVDVNLQSVQSNGARSFVDVQVDLYFSLELEGFKTGLQRHVIVCRLDVGREDLAVGWNSGQVSMWQNIQMDSVPPDSKPNTYMVIEDMFSDEEWREQQWERCLNPFKVKPSRLRTSGADSNGGKAETVV